MFCGLTEGKIVIFSAVADNPILRKRDPPELRWSMFRDLNLSEGRPVNKLLLVNEDSELWAPSGNMVFVISITTLEVQHEIRLTVPGTDWTRHSDVVDMVHSDTRVWCCCQDNGTVLEIDSISGRPISLISCNNTSVGDQISVQVTCADDDLPRNCSKPITGSSDSENTISISDTAQSEEVNATCLSDETNEDSEITPNKSDNISSQSEKISVQTGQITHTTEKLTEEFIPPPQLPPRLSKSAQHLRHNPKHKVSNIRNEENPEGAPIKSPPPLPIRCRKPQQYSRVPPPIPHRASKPSPSCTNVETSAEKSRTLPKQSMRSKPEHEELKQKKSRSLIEDKAYKESVFAGNGQLRLMAVKDTLWIGQQSGDVAIVSVTPNNNHGRVLSIMTNDVDVYTTCTSHPTRLLKAGTDSIISVDKTSPDNSVLFIWEVWGTEDVAEFSEYASTLRKLEQILRNKSL